MAGSPLHRRSHSRCRTPADGAPRRERDAERGPVGAHLRVGERDVEAFGLDHEPALPSLDLPGRGQAHHGQRADAIGERMPSSRARQRHCAGERVARVGGIGQFNHAARSRERQQARVDHLARVEDEQRLALCVAMLPRIQRHINNFGLYGTPQPDVVIDINDFDEATVGPWEWDLKRLVASVNVAGRENGLIAKRRRAAARRCVAGYSLDAQQLKSRGILETWSIFTYAELERNEARLKEAVRSGHVEAVME
jgi:hypothetical protein